MKTLEEIQNELKLQQETVVEKVNNTLKYTILPRLKDLGIEKVKFYFDGSGDSGEIYDVIGLETLESNSPLQSMLDSWAYDLLETTDVDWYNNEGGCGEISIDVNQESYAFEIHTRYTETHLAATAAIQL